MHEGKLVFAQVMAHLPLSTFRRCVARYDGEHKVKSFSCLDQFYAMAFAQLTFRESLRDIEACLATQSHRLYHLGFRSPVARNTLANANAVRPWQIYADLAQHSEPCSGSRHESDLGSAATTDERNVPTRHRRRLPSRGFHPPPLRLALVEPPRQHCSACASPPRREPVSELRHYL